MANQAGVTLAPLTDKLVIVESGDDAPGSDTTFAALGGSPYVNNSEAVVLMGTAGSDSGVWRYLGQTGSLAAIVGESAPDTSGTFNGFNVPTIADGGTAAFFGGTDAVYGGWAYASSGLEAIAITGEAAPGTDGTYKNTWPDDPPLNWPIAINASGNVAFSSRLDGTESAQSAGIWSGSIGNVSLVVQLGDDAPGTDTVFSGASSGFGPVVMNDSGTIAFGCEYGDSEANYGIWSGTTGSLSAIALTGETAPGVGTPFVEIDELVTIDADGDVALSASDPAGIWRTVDGELQAIAYAGQSVPTRTSVQFSSGGFVVPAINQSKQAAFYATYGEDVDDAGSGIFFCDASGTVSAIACTGDEAPGTAGRAFTSFFQPSINSKGQVAFLAQVGSGDYTGIWVTATDGTLTLVTMTGYTLLDGDSRIVSTLIANGSTGGEDGMPRSLTDGGAFCFLATFDDGSSGVYLFTIN